MLLPREAKWSNLNINVEIVGGGMLTLFLVHICMRCVCYVEAKGTAARDWEGS